MGKVAVIADVHLHNWPQFAVWENGINSRLLRTYECLEWVCTDAVKNGCTSIIVGGDLFHSRKHIEHSVIVYADMFLGFAESVGLEVFLLVGNHDLSMKGDGCNALSMFNGCAKVIDKQCVLDIPKFGKVGFVPWTEDPNEVLAAVEMADSKKAIGIIGHVGIGGGKVGPRDFEVPGSIAQGLFKADLFEWVILGHYHGSQVLNPDRQANMFYVGSPLQHNFGDRGGCHGYMIVENKKPAVFVENNISPRFIIKGETPEVIRKIDYVQVRASSSEIADEELEEVEVDIAPSVVIEKEHSTQVRLDVRGLSNDQILSEYLKKAGKEDDLLLLEGQKLLREVGA